jgi:hypothetical protein
MSRAQPKSSPTDQHARSIAAAIATGRPPALTPDLDLYLESSPREIFVAFEGVARHMPPGGKDETLALGYLFLLQQLLERVRYRTDRGYADAVRLIADFQADVAARVEAGHIDGHMLAYVGGALHQSKIPASPELAKASARQHVDDREGGPLSDDVHAALAGFLEACGDDPFVLVSSLVEFGHAMPAENRGALAAGLALCGATTRGAAVLFLLDPDRVVRRAVAGALATVASSLSPTEVRRLVAMRNWRPENERAEVDGIVRKARAAGVDCAQWEAGSTETILATAIDGAATQGFLLVSPAGRKKRISSILTKGGVVDAWSGEPESRRRIEATLAESGMDAPMLAVSRSYLDRVLSHQLALSVERGAAPPLGLLQVAETLGGVDWQPARMDFGETLARLIAEIPEAMRRGTAFETVLRKSGRLADLEAVAQSWFEDGPDIAQAIAGARTRNRAKVATYLLQSVFARHRDKWADLLLRTALWMREAPLELDLCWRGLAIVAKALADGRDMGEIGLMRDIAQRTLAILANDRRM